MLSLLLQFINDPTSSPHLYAVVTAVASLALTVIARRGTNLPLLSALLTYLIGRQPGQPAGPNAPATPAGHPVLDALLAALKQRLGGATPTGFTLLPDAGNPSKVAVEFHTDPAK